MRASEVKESSQEVERLLRASWDKGTGRRTEDPASWCVHDGHWRLAARVKEGRGLLFFASLLQSLT